MISMHTDGAVIGTQWGRGQGVPAPPPLFWVKKKKIKEGRKGSRASNSTHYTHNQTHRRYHPYKGQIGVSVIIR